MKLTPEDLRKRYEKQQEQGKRTPLDDEPELYPDLGWVWEAFRILSDERRYDGGAPLRITTSEVVLFARMEGLTEDEAVRLLHLVRAMDTAYLGHVREQQTKRKTDGNRDRNARHGTRRPRIGGGGQAR